MEHVKFYIYYNQNTFYRVEDTHARTHMHSQVRTSTPYRSSLNFILGFPLWMLCWRWCCVCLWPSCCYRYYYCSFHLSSRLPCSFIHIMLITSFFLRLMLVRFILSFLPRQFSIQSRIVCHFVFVLLFCVCRKVPLLLSLGYECRLSLCFLCVCTSRCFRVLSFNSDI